MGLLRGTRRALLAAREPKLDDIAGLKAHYDFSVLTSLYADSALTTLASPAGVIGGVLDLSRTGNTATQTTAGAKPTLTANSINGRYAAVFDGGDYLIADGIAAAAGVSGSDKPFTLAAVVQFSSVAAIRQIFCFGRAAGNNTLRMLGISSVPAWMFYSNDDSDAALSPNGGTPDTSAHVVIAAFSGTTASIFVDGVTVVNEANSDVGTCTLDQAAIGVQRTFGALTQAMLGSIGQLAVFNRRIATPEALWATRLLGAKWGINVS